MIKVVIAPEELYTLSKRKAIKIFLSGGISTGPNWQQEFIDGCKNKLKKDNHVIFYNPRRESIDLSSKSEAENQIVWEFEHLEQVDRIVFWFPKGLFNPAALYELGRYVGKKEVIIGIDPESESKIDIELQSKLAGYKKKFANSIPELVDLFIKDAELAPSRTIGVHQLSS
jgi:hypothetical protein